MLTYFLSRIDEFVFYQKQMVELRGNDGRLDRLGIQCMISSLSAVRTSYQSTLAHPSSIDLVSETLPPPPPAPPHSPAQPIANDAATILENYSIISIQQQPL